MEMDTGPVLVLEPPKHDLAWQLPAPTAPPGLGKADTIPRKSFRGAHHSLEILPRSSAQKHTVPRSRLLLGDSSEERARVLYLPSTWAGPTEITPERKRMHERIIKASECLKNWWDRGVIAQQPYQRTMVPDDGKVEDESGSIEGLPGILFRLCHSNIRLHVIGTGRASDDQKT